MCRGYKIVNIEKSKDNILSFDVTEKPDLSGVLNLATRRRNPYVQF